MKNKKEFLFSVFCMSFGGSECVYYDLAKKEVCIVSLSLEDETTAEII